MSEALGTVDVALEQREQPTLADVIDLAIVHADQQRAELAEAGDIEGLAHGLHAIRDVARKLSMLERQTDGDVSRLVRSHDMQNPEVPGLGVLEVRRKSTRTRWESDRLFGLLVDALCTVTDTETGEKVGDEDTAAMIADRLRSYLAPALPLTASMGWRVTGLKEAGIDPNRFREQEFGPDTTRIVTPDGA